MTELPPTGLLAGGAGAPYKVFASDETLAQGEFTSPEHSNTEGRRPPSAAETQKERHAVSVSSFLEHRNTIDANDLYKNENSAC